MRLWTTVCPMKVMEDTDMTARLGLYGRWSRYRVLPRAGGLGDQLAIHLDAFDLIDGVLREPDPSVKKKRHG